ncbi:MAG: hypothetical protein GY856_10575 [bacterium]|nr:hypothetical protein [bacterium]
MIISKLDCKGTAPAIIAWLMAAIITGTPTMAGTADPDESGPLTLGASLPEYEVVRCMFREGRMVVRYHGKLVVLRPGDSLPDSTAQVVEINDRRAVITQNVTMTRSSHQETAVMVPERMLIITPGDQGRLELQEMTSRPSAEELGPNVHLRRSIGVKVAPQAPAESEKNTERDDVM